MTSGFQEIHVWEGLNPRLRSVDGYERSMQTGVNNYYTQNPELFRPNRQLYMDGVMQSSTIGDEAYHEGLVHPAMFAHAEGPKRVAIIGGGEGATLREILKHKSVEVCTMIEIDPGIVKASRLWLPRMNDCSDFGTGNCFDERRTELLLEDAFGYFLNRFKREGEIPEELKTDPYDVIVMDALDPDDTIEFAVQMYQDTVFWGTLNEALTHSGILVVQLGMTPDSKSYGEQFGVFKNRANLFQSVEGAGFEQMFIYHDTHSDFKFPWSYLIACKSKDCASEWKRNEAEMSLRMHERILPSKSGKPMLKHFDGATMQSYMRPYKTWESVHCKKEPTPEECTLFDGTSLAVSWDDAFELVYVEGDGKTNQILVAKMDLIAGATIFDDRGTSGKGLSSMITEQHPQHPFPTVDAATWSRPTCGVTRKLSNVDLSGKISPLRERQSHLFEMVETTKDVSKGERFIC
jgi:spermidine synthase